MYICMNVSICVHMYLYVSMLVACKSILFVCIYKCMYMYGNASMLICEHESVPMYIYVHV